MHPQKQWLVMAAACFTLSACNGETPAKATGITDPTLTRSLEVSSASSITSEVRLAVGESTKLDASGSLQRSRSTGWVSSNAAVASVTGTGVVQGRSAGNATITAFGFTVRKVYAIVVTAPAPARVASVAVTSPMSSLPVGATMQMSARAASAQDSLITDRVTTWSVLSGAAISLSSSGLVTALSAGTATVAATVDGVVGTLSITVTDPPPTVTSFLVTPKTGASLLPAQTRQFTTATTWSDLASRAVTVSYTATGGTITNSGLFTAGQLAGTFMVIANCTCGRVDTASVSVSIPAQLTSLTISPKTVSLAPAGTQQFTAAAIWNSGATTLPAVTYTAEGGLITTGGLYTAPSVPGTYRVFLSSAAGTVRDTATVTVTSASLWNVLRDFNTGIVGATAQGTQDGFTGDAGQSRYSAEKSFEGGQSAKLTIQQGTTGFGLWGGVILFPTALPTGSDFWLQLYIFIPEDFVVLTPTNGSLKFIRIRTRSSTGSYGGYNDIQLQDDANQPTSMRMIKEDQQQWFNFGAANSFTKGSWQRVTVNLKLSSIPKASGGDSRTRVWQNGKLLTDETRMRTLSGLGDVADALYLFTYWNGSAPKTQSLFVDKIQMANFQPSWASDLEGISQ